METIGLQEEGASPAGHHRALLVRKRACRPCPYPLFHRICIPFEPFDSGLDYVPQPERTELVVEWIHLGLDDPAALDGVEIAMGQTPDVEASIYLGAAHNWYEIEKLTLTRDGSCYRVASAGTVEFAREGVAIDERFTFQATAVHRGAA